MVDKVTNSKILKKLMERDKRFDGVDSKFVSIDKHLDGIDVSLSYLSKEVFNIKMDLTQIKEDTAKIPELQRLLELTAGANLVDRQERKFMSNSINGHEERLVVVEDALSITPAERVLF